MATPNNKTAPREKDIDEYEDPCPEESHIDSASKQQHGGFDCQFIDSPPENLPVHCPICFLVLREPYQLECCGHIFCQTCIEQVRVNNKPCPTCNRAEFLMFADKRLRQSLYAYRVRCTLEKEGCQWVGELRELEKHLNKSPKPDQQLTGCDFVEISCNHCSESLHRHRINAHQSEECTLRPFSCIYCRSYESSYDNVVNNHWKECKCHPVSCPNDCGTYPDRQSITQHVNKDCPLTSVKCDFHYAGCEVQLPRKDMAGHLLDNLKGHVSLMAAHSHRLAEEMVCKDVQIAQLKEAVKEFERKSRVLREQVQGVVVDCEQHRERHTHMNTSIVALFFAVLVVVIALGIGIIKQDMAQVNEHMQHMEQEVLESSLEYIKKQTSGLKEEQEQLVLQIDIDFSEMLRKEQASRELLEKDIAQSRKGQKDMEKQIAELKKKQKKTVSKIEFDVEFIRNELKQQLERFQNEQTSRELLEEDITRFRKDRRRIEKQVTEVRRKQELEWHILKEHSTSLVPVQIIMEDVKSHKDSDMPWYSQPFYSHVQGYKLCLRVDVNGVGDGRGTHLSVHIHLMRGEFDSYLMWPFRGTIAVQLVSLDPTLREHHIGTIPFNDRTPNAYAQRVTSGEVAKHGLGYQQFVKISKSFLHNNQLHFRITDIQLKSRKQ